MEASGPWGSPPSSEESGAEGEDRHRARASLRSEEEGEEEEEEEEGSESPEMQYMFEVPLLEYAANSDESADVKRAYALVDRLSYLDWGLRTEDEVVGKRSASLASHNSDWNGCIVHDGSMWGEAAHGFGPSGPRTARTSEGYGEATVATATDEVTRVVIVQPDYSPVSIAAQAVPESSLLIFENVRGHIGIPRKLSSCQYVVATGQMFCHARSERDT